MPYFPPSYFPPSYFYESPATSDPIPTTLPILSQAYFPPDYFAPSYFPPSYFYESPATSDPIPTTLPILSQAYFPPDYFAPSYFYPIGLYHILADDLVDAVVARIQGALVPSSMSWFGTGEDPGASTAPLPYAVLVEPDEDDSYWNTSGDQQVDGHLEIHCYAATKKASRALGDAIAGQLNDAPLVFKAGLLIYLRQSSRSAMKDPDPAPGGGDCWDETRLFHFIYSA